MFTKETKGNPGTMLEEMHFLRSWSYETQLWHYDIVDVEPANHIPTAKPKTEAEHLKNMEKYYERLRPKFSSASIENKVPFHHMEFTTEATEWFYGQIDPYHGLSWRVVKADPPREIRVLRVEPDSPAEEKVLTEPIINRGDKLLKFNNIDVVNTKNSSEIYDINFMLQGKWKLNLDEAVSYEFEDKATKKKKTRTLKAKRNEVVPVSHSRVITTKDGKKVGYVALDSLASYLTERKLNTEFIKFKNDEVSDLILDLRHNSGGLILFAAQVAYMIAGEKNTKGKNFAKLKLNYDSNSTTPKKNKIPLDPIEFGKECYKDSPIDCGASSFLWEFRRIYHSLDLDRVFILTSHETCGASEALINGLRGAGIDVILIGTGTCGQIYGSLPEKNCGFTYFSVQFQVKNGIDFGSYGDGFTPKNTPSEKGVKVKGCYLVDDLDKSIGSDDDVLLSTALQYREKGEKACPAVPTSLQVRTRSANHLGNVSNTEVTPPPIRLYGYNMDITIPNRR